MAPLRGGAEGCVGEWPLGRFPLPLPVRERFRCDCVAGAEAATGAPWVGGIGAPEAGIADPIRPRSRAVEWSSHSLPLMVGLTLP